MEEERARLRRRLRENVIGGEFAGEEDDDLASRKAMRNEINDLKIRLK